MIDLVLAANDAEAIKRELTSSDVEACAILYTTQTRRSDSKIRLLVRELELASDADYSRRGPLEAELLPAFVARVTKRARREKYGLVFVHSHPGDDPPTFSPVDWRGEQQLAAFLAHRLPDPVHAALVMSRGGMQARCLGSKEGIRVVAVGSRRQVLSDPVGKTESKLSEVFDRQIRVFGPAAQRALEELRVAVVGLGGIGSLVAQELVHLGVRDFIIVDADVLEASNLNRVAGATPNDLGRAKIEIAERYIRSVSANGSVVSIQGDVTKASTARALLNADCICCCTDSHGSRAVVQQVAYQYLIPCIDMGTTIAVKESQITHIYGRVQLLAPGLACLICNSLLDSSQVRRDMMTPFERQADPYLQGAHEPAPAVMSLNGTVGSLAVTMLLSVICGIPVSARHLLYNALASTLRSVRGQPNPQCFICSRSGAYGRGDTWPLPGRQD